MTKRVIECYEITAKIVVRKKFWDDSGFGVMSVENVCDRLQQGLEMPLEDIDISIKE